MGKNEFMLYVAFEALWVRNKDILDLLLLFFRSGSKIFSADFVGLSS